MGSKTNPTERSAIATLIRESVNGYFDADIHADNVEMIKARRATMREKMQKRGWLKSALGEGAE